MAFKLPRLVSNAAIVSQNGIPTPTFVIWWQTVVQQLEQAINAIVYLTGISSDFATAITNAQNAANTANAAAAAAQAQADAARRESALNNSYITPDSVLTATTTTITIASHVRHYGDGSSVSVNGGTVAATAAADVDYIYYNDPMRAGGTVAYQVALTNPAQTGDTHVVGAVTIPASGSNPGGRGPVKPGLVDPTT